MFDGVGAIIHFECSIQQAGIHILRHSGFAFCFSLEVFYAFDCGSPQGRPRFLQDNQ
jgi:hypothetical protein